MKKFLSIILTSALVCSVLSGCGISEAAQSAQSLIDSLPSEYSEDISGQLKQANDTYNALSDEDKQDVNAENLEALNSAEAEAIAKAEAEAKAKAEAEAAEIDAFNTEIAELEIKTTDASGLNASCASIEKIMKELENLPTDYDDRIDYKTLSNKVTNVYNRITSLVRDCDNDTENITNIYNELNSMYSMSRGSAIYGSCCNMEGYLDNLSTHIDKGETPEKLSELKKQCLDVSNADMLPMYVATLGIRVAELMGELDYYNPYFNKTFDYVEPLSGYISEIKARGNL